MSKTEQSLLTVTVARRHYLRHDRARLAASLSWNGLVDVVNNILKREKLSSGGW